MAGFDTTDIAAGYKPAGQDLFGNIAQLAAIQNAFNQNRMFQAQRAVGQAMQGAIDPATGAYNPQAANRMIMGDPRAGPAVSDALAANQVYAGNAQTINAKWGDMVEKTAALAPKGLDEVGQLAWTNRTLSALGAPPAIMAGYLGGNPLPSGRSMFDALGSAPVPAAPAGASAPADVFAATRGAGINALGPGTGPYQQQFGIPTQVATPQGTVAGLQSPMTGAIAPANMVANQLGPRDLSTPVETVDAEGTKHMGVLGDYVDPATGGWKDGVAHPITALGPLSQAANAALGSAYGPQIATFEQAAATAPQTRQFIENARQEAQSFVSGPQSDLAKRWGEFLGQFGIKAPDFANMPATAAREAFGKSLVQILSGQQSALHMNQTDAARQTAEAAVPSSVTTPEGLRQIFGIIEGNTDAINAEGKAWAAQKGKSGPSSWGQFQMEFPNRVPPSIFQAQYMSREEVAAMQKGWSPQKRADWQRRYGTAKKLGWLPNDQ